MKNILWSAILLVWFSRRFKYESIFILRLSTSYLESSVLVWWTVWLLSRVLYHFFNTANSQEEQQVVPGPKGVTEPA